MLVNNYFGNGKFEIVKKWMWSIGDDGTMQVKASPHVLKCFFKIKKLITAKIIVMPTDLTKKPKIKNIERRKKLNPIILLSVKYFCAKKNESNNIKINIGSESTL